MKESWQYFLEESVKKFPNDFEENSRNSRNNRKKSQDKVLNKPQQEFLERILVEIPERITLKGRTLLKEFE